MSSKQKIDKEYMSTPTEKLEEILQAHSNSPFLFIGSGFSQRYLGLPTWENLLRQFCPNAQPFEYYMTSSDSNLAKCASLIAKDYSEQWWKDPNTSELRQEYQAHLRSQTSPLKIAISHFLASKIPDGINFDLEPEIAALRTLNIEGIVTTNWDLLLEEIFPGYKVYIGQQSIVTQTPQNIAEIYKIHGCCSDPNSLVLTEDDYTSFKQKQAYLAAKLITIFVEHPVIFIGYSISDPNIIDLLRAILRGLGQSEIAKLQKNLIFIQRSKDDRLPGVLQTLLVVEDIQLPVTQIVCDDFISVYNSISKTRLKLPTRVLRFCKEQLCELVASKEPSEKLYLLDIDELEHHQEVEFVVGVGVASGRVAEIGYRGITIEDVLKDLIGIGGSELDPNAILEHALPALCNGRNYLPVFKFLYDAKKSAECYNDTVRRLIDIDDESLRNKNYADYSARILSEHDFTSLINNFAPEKSAQIIPHMRFDQIDCSLLMQFIKDNFQRAVKSNYSSYFRKLFCLYDRLEYRDKYKSATKNKS